MCLFFLIGYDRLKTQTVLQVWYSSTVSSAVYGVISFSFRFLSIKLNDYNQ